MNVYSKQEPELKFKPQLKLIKILRNSYSTLNFRFIQLQKKKKKVSRDKMSMLAWQASISYFSSSSSR